MKSSFHKAFESVTGTAYVVLMTNILVGLPLMPLVLLYVTADISLTWHPMVLAAPWVAPLLTAAFGVLGRFSEQGSITVIRGFVAALKQTFRKALAVGAMTVAGLTLIVLDIAFLWGSRWGAVLIPVLVTLGVVGLATAVTVLVALASEPDARLTLAWKASLGLTVRRWYLSAVSVMVLAIFAGFVLAQPALALGLALTPALYLVWANARFSLRPVLPAPAPAARAA